MARKENKTGPANNALSTGKPTVEEIAARAHAYYEQEGCIEGRADDHWLRAESDLMRERASAQPNQGAERSAPRSRKTAGDPSQN